MGLTLVTGGARSGKSRWAETLAGRHGERVLYVATAPATGHGGYREDPEMRERIRRHRRRRPAGWTTLEEPLDVAGAVRERLSQSPRPAAVLVDCLTLLVSNWLLQDRPQMLEFAGETADALAALPCPAVVVTNEVGGGVVPESSLGRRFRDLAGLVNQRFAARAARVYVLWAGIPVEIASLDARRRAGGRGETGRELGRDLP